MFSEKLTIKDHVTFLTKTFKMGVVSFDYKVPTKMFSNPNCAKVVLKNKEKLFKEVITFSDTTYNVFLTPAICTKTSELTNKSLNKLWQKFLTEKFGTKYSSFIKQKETTR